MYKFRAWDKKNKRMCLIWHIYYKAWEEEGYINSVQVEAIDLPDGTYELLDHEVILLQFTGLKDKNGKEVYDGDILKSYDGDGSNIVEVYWNDHNGGFFVKSHLNDVNNPIYYFTEINKDLFYKTGNIYEMRENHAFTI